MSKKASYLLTTALVVGFLGIPRAQALDLLAYFDFNDDSDPAAALEVSGNAPDAILNGPAFIGADAGGVTGSAGDRALDLGTVGNGASAIVPAGTHFDSAVENQAMAVSWWQKIDAIGNTSSFWIHSPTATGNQRGFQAHVPWGDGTIYFDQGGCCGPLQRNTVGGAITPGEWQHFVLQRGPEGPRQIWVNGELLASTDGVAPLLAFNGIMTIGAEGNNNNNSMSGLLDDMAVFNGVLAQDEIVSLADGSLNPGTLITPPADEDGDGLPDAYEQTIIDADPADDVDGLDDVSDTSDFDNDGSSDAAEYAAETDPLDSDSDDDGSSDGEEAAAGTDPLDEDSDGDGLLDGVETNTGTFVDANNTGSDPLDRDSDDDLVFDGQEVDGGFDPNDPDSRPEISLANHTPERVLYRRTDNLPGADFTGILPDNVDQEAPFGELDDPSSFLLEGIDVDREPGGLGTDLTGDNHDLAYIFQFYDADGVFSFTENYDDRVKIVATPIAGATNLNPAGDPSQHTDVSWNTRTFANFDFGGGGWFNVDIWLSEDGGGAQSAADIGFGYYNDFSLNTADFGGVGYTSVFGISSGAPAEFDTDGFGLSWGVYLDSFDPSVDTDGDSIPDGYEEQFFPGDLAQLGPGDFDEDGVNDPDEYVDGTDPTEPDVDNDGSNDGEEKADGTSPFDPDTDDDGLLDGVETNTGTFVSASDTGTDPLARDTDGDGVSDGAELEFNTDPTDAASGTEAITDLNTLSILPSGNYSFLGGGDVVTARVDNDGTYSWLLVGRGREGWTWDAAGQGSVSDVSQGLGTPDAFEPAAYSTDFINDLITTSGSDLLGVEIRIKRSSNPEGSAYEEARWRPTGEAAWRWNFDTGMNVEYEVVETNGVQGGQLGSRIVNTRDGELGGNDGDRIFTWNWANHGVSGFSFGSLVGNGSNNATSFLWENTDENHAIPYAEIYIRLKDPGVIVGEDSDNDGIVDLIETGLVGNLDDLSAGDDDGDGLNSPDEISTHSTDPLVADTDEDGANDGAEITAGTDPLNADTDGDGLLDGVETNTGVFVSASDTGSDPLAADTDEDGASDGFEVSENFDPNDPDSSPDIPVVQPSFVPINELVPGAYGPDFAQNGVDYQENHYGGGVIFNNNAQNNYDVHTSGNPAPLRSFDAIAPLTSHGNGGGQISNRNLPWGDGGGENFTVRYNGYLDMSTYAPGTYNIHLGADDTNYFIMDTADGQVTAQHNCCPQNQVTSFTITIPGIFPFDNVFGEQGGGDWLDVGISGPGIAGIVAIGDTDAGSPPVYPIGVRSEDTDGDDLPDAWETNWADINDLTQLSGADDFDNDGSTDLEEFTARTDPTNPDTDEDGVADGAETGTGTFVDASDTGTDPLNPDTDGDGLSDGVESNSGTFVSVSDTGTSPHDIDTDGDGFEDLDEVESLFDPTDPGSVPPIPQPELLAYWNFEGQSEDQTGNGADLTLQGPAVLSAAGDGHLGEGQSLDLGGVNNRAYAITNPGSWFDAAYDNNAMAVSFWQYNTQVGNTSAFWIHAPAATGGQRGFQAHTPWGNGTVYFDQSGCCGGPQRLTVGGVVNLNEWQHFVFQRDAEGNREIWVDGVKVAEAGGGEPLDAFDGVITIGAEGNTNNNSFGGRIDEMAVFDLPLHPTRIAELADGAPVGSKPGIDPLGLAVNPAPGGEIELVWKSTLGKFYDVLISPDLSSPRETWAGLAGAQDIAADPSGTNTLVIPLPFPEEGFVAVREKNPPPLFSDDLETGAAGWTTIVNDEFGNTEWELGSPNGTTGPLSGAGDSVSAWCTGLGDYGVDSDISLRTPAIDLSGVATALLTFDAYRDADGFGDTATVRFLRAADQSQLGEDVSLDMTVFDLDYTTIEVLVPAAAIGESILIEFNFVSDGSLDSFSGLCIDNVNVQVP